MKQKRYSDRKFQKARRQHFGTDTPVKATPQRVGKKPKVRGAASRGGVAEDLGQR